MASRLELIGGKSRLEELLGVMDFTQKKLELKVYDLLSTSRVSYLDDQEAILDREIDLLLNSDVRSFEDSQRADVKSRFLSWLQKYGHAPAYIIALNFDPIVGHEQHVFRGGNDIVFSDKPFDSEELRLPLYELGYKDGAIIIRSNGQIHTVRAQLTNIDPKAIHADKTDINLNDPRVYGFKGTVNVRHFSALGASFHLPGLVTYTLSEETGDIRRYEKGEITFSTFQDEVDYHYPAS